MPQNPVQYHSNAQPGRGQVGAWKEEQSWAAEPLNKIIKNNERTSVAIVGVLELYTTLKWGSHNRERDARCSLTLWGMLNAAHKLKGRSAPSLRIPFVVELVAGCSVFVSGSAGNCNYICKIVLRCRRRPKWKLCGVGGGACWNGNKTSLLLPAPHSW